MTSDTDLWLFLGWRLLGFVVVVNQGYLLVVVLGMEVVNSDCWRCPGLAVGGGCCDGGC